MNSKGSEGADPPFLVISNFKPETYHRGQAYHVRDPRPVRNSRRNNTIKVLYTDTKARLLTSVMMILTLLILCLVFSSCRHTSTVLIHSRPRLRSENFS